MKVGFIGLGIMGRPMAKNLVKAGFDLFVCDHHESSVKELVDLGAHAVSNGREAAEQSDVVITMLQNSPNVEDAALGKGGIVEGAHEGLIFVDMSSIAPLASRKIHDALAQKSIAMIDAPVSGGEPKAVDGTLAVMVGGDRETFDTVVDVLDAMASSVTYVGDIGAGNIAKLANQTIVAVNIAAVAEALVLARKSGVDPEGVFEAIRGGLAGSTVMEAKVPMMLDRDFAPGFRINLHTKDLNNVLDTGHAVQSPLPLTSLVRDMMSILEGDGCAGDDHAALLKVYEKLANVELRRGEPSE